jgi:hypothetical protein
MEYHEVSAINSENIENAFVALTSRIHQRSLSTDRKRRSKEKYGTIGSSSFWSYCCCCCFSEKKPNKKYQTTNKDTVNPLVSGEIVQQK